MKKKDQLDFLKDEAKKVSKNSYSPYSRFKVGASFVDSTGKVFSGCNVENIAFPSGICAERSAIVRGISDVGPKLKIKVMVIYTPTETITTPCGGCRQVIQEFADTDTTIICICDSDDQLIVSLEALLPNPPKIEL